MMSDESTSVRETTGKDICADCAAELPYIDIACPRCALPLPFLRSATHASNNSSLLCGHCLQQQPVLDAVHAVFHYQTPVAGLIQGLKFNGRLSHARLLGQLMLEHVIKKHIARPELLLPVPLHVNRLRERGFNQSMELARYIGQGIEVPVAVDACLRQGDTVSQSSLPARKRRDNVRNVFVARRTLQACHVVIIDDVMTTGSTANELARVLRNAGARRVDLWVCARVAE